MSKGLCTFWQCACTTCARASDDHDERTTSALRKPCGVARNISSAAAHGASTLASIAASSVALGRKQAAVRLQVGSRGWPGSKQPRDSSRQPHAAACAGRCARHPGSALALDGGESRTHASSPCLHRHSWQDQLGIVLVARLSHAARQLLDDPCAKDLEILLARRKCQGGGGYSAGREQQGALPKRRPCQCHGRVTLTHAMCTQVVQPGDLVVDATCGNGHDTLALAQLVGPRGTVHAFDLQPAAIDSTRSQLNDHCKDGAAPAVHLHCESHAQMRERVPDDSAALVAFNLGYLPHGDHSVVTEAATTTVAVRSALQVRTEAVCLACTVCGSACNGGAREHERCLRSVARDAWVSCAVPQGAGSLHHHCVCRPRPGQHRARGCGAAAASAAFGRIRVPGDDATQSQPGAAAAERLEGTQWRKYSVDRRHVTAGPRCPAAGARDAVEMVRMLCWHVLQAVDRRN